jgi:hypothetical protein
MRSLLVLLLTLVLAAPAAAQERLITHVDAPTPIAAYQDVIAWSVRNPVTGRWSLMTNRGPVRVPTRGAPFDVDLGPGVREEVVAVYSRCERETGGLGVYATLVEQWRGCDLYRATLTGQETRIASASSGTADETWPSIWRDRVGFARRYDRRLGAPYLYVNDGGRSKRVPGGTQRRSRPSGVELYGRRLGFSWAYQGRGETPAFDVRVHDVDGTARSVVDQFDGGGLTGIIPSWPGFEAGRVEWMRGCFGDPGGCVGGRDGIFTARYILRRPIASRLAFPAGDRVVLSHDRAGGVTYLLIDRTFVGDCQGDPPNPAGTCDLVALSG